VQGNPQAYFAAWAAVRDHATSCAVRAWMFQSEENPSQFIEFLEWKQSEVQLDATLATQYADLDRFGPATTRNWVEP
jgi:hypothetical protein